MWAVNEPKEKHPPTLRGVVANETTCTIHVEKIGPKTRFPHIGDPVGKPSYLTIKRKLAYILSFIS